MNDLVAIISVIVTGVAAPLIVSAVALMQWRLSERSQASRDRRKALNECATYVSQAARAGSHSLALWSRGIPEHSDESREHIVLVRNAIEGTTVAYGSLCILIGPDSAAARRYAECILRLSDLTDVLRAYRTGAPFADWEDGAGSALASLRGTITLYLHAAHATASG